jgi:midasin (ATPase involved in ribosome maturation)
MRYIVNHISLTSKDFESLEALLKLWSHMAYMLNEEDFDPSYYSVFRNLLEEWVARIDSPSLSGFGGHVHSELNGLSGSIALSTGMSMPVIWEVARARVPSSLEHWKIYNRLITLMDDFESKVAFQTGMGIVL